MIEKINATEKGGKVNAKLDEGANVPATVIDALKNKGVTGIFEIGGNAPAANSNPEAGGEVATTMPNAASEATVSVEPVVPEVPAVIEPAAPAEAEAPAAQVAPEAESGVPVWAIVTMAIAAVAVVGGAACAVIRRKHQDS